VLEFVFMPLEVMIEVALVITMSSKDAITYFINKAVYEYMLLGNEDDGVWTKVERRTDRKVRFMEARSSSGWKRDS
jgi:hypothetical protein